MFCYAVGGIGKALALCLCRTLLLLGRFPLTCDLRHTILQRCDLLGNAAAAAVLFGKLLLHAGNVRPAVAAVGLQNGNLAPHALCQRLHLRDLLSELIGLHITVVQVKGQGLGRHIKLIKRLVLPL